MSLRTTLRIWVFSDAESINLSCLQSPEICHACRVQKSTTLTESKNLSRLQSPEINHACRVQKSVTLYSPRGHPRLCRRWLLSRRILRAGGDFCSRRCSETAMIFVPAESQSRRWFLPRRILLLLPLLEKNNNSQKMKRTKMFFCTFNFEMNPDRNLF